MNLSDIDAFDRIFRALLGTEVARSEPPRVPTRDHTCTERLVLFRTYNKGPYLFLEVVDHGVGIEEDLLSQVSEPFFTTKELGKGTGLGLTIASELTAELGGELSFTSSRGSGSTFTIMLETFQSPEPATDTQMTA